MTEVVEKGLRKIGITMSKPILAAVCIIFGILVMVWEPVLRYLVGIFFIIEGALLLTEYIELQRQQSSQTKPA